MEGLRKIREMRHFTQDALAKKIGVGRTTVTLWEKGVNKPNSEMLLKMAEALKCSVDALLCHKT